MTKKDRKRLRRMWRIIKASLEVFLIAVTVIGIISFFKSLFVTNILIPAISLIIVFSGIIEFSKIYYLFTLSEYIAIKANKKSH